MRRPLINISFSIIFGILIVISGPQAAVANEHQQPQPPATAEPIGAKILRVAEEKNKHVALEIATLTLEHPEGKRPKVSLVSVAHIADQSFFDAVQKLLSEHDIVLYESVKPPGASGPRGDTPEQRIESTRSALKFIAGIARAYESEKGRLPDDLNKLKEFVRSHDSRLAEFLDAANVDAWGRTVQFIAATADSPSAVQSLGSDGKPGGDGEAADVRINTSDAPDLLAAAREDNLQAQFASALNLKFQLTSLNYDQPNWRCSDMAMDEVVRGLAERGIDFAQFGGTLAGSSLPGKVISLLLGLIRAADRMTEGALADMCKIMLIEMLSSDEAINQAMTQMGRGFGEIIIDARNQIAIDDLKSISEKEPNVKSVAILYGAAHMPDMIQRLIQQLGYELKGEQWLTAISVDLAKSKLSPAEAARRRAMLRNSIQQMQKRNPNPRP